MNAGLKDLLGLPENHAAPTNGATGELRKAFQENMANLNRDLQVLATEGSRNDFQQYDAQRQKLYQAFQKASSKANGSDPNGGKRDLERVIAALRAVETKAAVSAGGASAARDNWLQQEGDFDEALAHIGQLEEAGDAKAPALRKLGDAIRAHANDHLFGDASATFGQFRPKLDQILARRGSPAPNAESPQAGPPGDFVSPDTPPAVAWKQLQPRLQETNEKIEQLEEAQFPNASRYRQQLREIQIQADDDQFQSAIPAHVRLREEVDAELERLYRGRLGGVTLPPEGDGAATQAPPASLPTDFISASVGKGGKNDPADVKAVQQALNQRGDAKLKDDGRFGPQTLKALEAFQRKLGQFKPDGVIEPGRGTARALSGAVKIPPTPPEPKPIAPPDVEKEYGKPALDKGAFVWHSTRGILDTNIEELKKGVRAAYGTEDGSLMKQIDQCLVKLGGVVEKLDTRLADALDAANNAPNDEARVTELKHAAGIMKDYLQYVKSEPLINHMDDNPFGVNTSLKKVISDALKHLSALLPKKPAGTERE